MKSLSDQIKISTAITPTAGVAGTDDIEGATLDMKGWDGVLMLVRFGAITENAVTSIKAQQSVNSDMSSSDDLASSGQTVADDDDDETFVIDIVRPQKRYVRLYVDRGTQNAVVASANYIQYRGKHVPASAHGTGVTVEKIVPAVAGTA